MASLLDLEAPRQQAERVGAVHREEAPAVVRDLAELALLDQLRGVAHERSPAVVVTHTGDHARLPGSALRAHRLLRRAADRLLAEDVLAGRAGRLDQLDVEHVRRRDDHDVDVRVVHDPAPVLRALLEPERPHRVLGARGHGVGADHQPEIELAVLEQRRDAQHRPAVGLAEPAETDHRDQPQRVRRGARAQRRRGRARSVLRRMSCVPLLRGNRWRRRSASATAIGNALETPQWRRSRPWRAEARQSPAVCRSAPTRGYSAASSGRPGAADSTRRAWCARPIGRSFRARSDAARQVAHGRAGAPVATTLEQLDGELAHRLPRLIDGGQRDVPHRRERRVVVADQ